MMKIIKECTLLAKTDNAFENLGVFNPACIRVGGDIHMFYRAVRIGNFSTIGYCRLDTPTHVAERSTHPLMIPEMDYEIQGVEDPRIVEIDGTYYMTYTAYDGMNAFGALATSTDLKTWERHGLISPTFTYAQLNDFIVHWHKDLSDKYLRFYKMYKARMGHDINTDRYVWDKDFTFFPRKINGKFAFLHRLYPSIQVVYFDDLKELTPEFWNHYLIHLQDYIVLESKYDFEASYIGGGCPPIETAEGWLIIYHGVQDTVNGYVYHAAAALMDINDPTKEISRLKEPLFSPEEEWEKKGYVNNVVFPAGAVQMDNDLYIYYGAADNCIAVAKLDINELIDELINNKHQ